MTLWDVVAAQLRRPSGPLAPVAGAVMRTINRQPYRLAIDALDVRPDDAVLELGFGPGEGVRELSRLAPRGLIWGVDHSQAMLAEASRRNAAGLACNQVRLSHASFEQLPIQDGSVDRVLAVNVAYFWGDGDAVLREIGRVLRPGGRLSVYVTAAEAMRHWKFAGAATHRTFSARDLLDLLARAPFDPERVWIKPLKLGFGVDALVATADRP